MDRNHKRRVQFPKATPEYTAIEKLDAVLLCLAVRFVNVTEEVTARFDFRYFASQILTRLPPLKLRFNMKKVRKHKHLSREVTKKSAGVIVK